MNVTGDHALAGQVALVTGAGRGIGRGAVVGLAQRGARVVALARTQEELEYTAELAKGASGEVVVRSVDLRDRAQVDEVLRDSGEVNILVNNAAMLPLKPFEETDPQLWQDTLEVNLHAAYYLAWRCYPAMMKRKVGRIVNVSSGAGVRPFILETAYCASKYAMEGLFKSLALEALPHGVVVTLTTPGKRTKPTSVTEAEYAQLSEAERQQYVDALDFAEAFGYLGAADDLVLSGKRFDLNAISALVRDEGWQVPAWRVLQHAERSY